MNELVEVRLVGVPVRLRGRSMQHVEELVREMTLISQQVEHSDGQTLPARLVQLAQEIRTTYGPLTTKADELSARAVERGDEFIEEIVYEVPPSITTFIHHLGEILAEADEFCRAGQHLLTLATPPDVAVYRRWTFSEFERQIAGMRPTPWPEHAARAAESDAS